MFTSTIFIYDLTTDRLFSYHHWFYNPTIGIVTCSMFNSHLCSMDLVSSWFFCPSFHEFLSFSFSPFTSNRPRQVVILHQRNPHDHAKQSNIHSNEMFGLLSTDEIVALEHKTMPCCGLESKRPGDINGDGRVDLGDIIGGLQILSGSKNP